MRRKEENYFFRLSAYQDALLELLERGDYVQPGARRNEVIGRIRQGLHDVPISRTTGSDWGVEYFAHRNDCTIGPGDWNRATEMMAAEGFVDCYRQHHSEPGYTRHPAVQNLREPGPEFWNRTKHAAGLSEDAHLAPAVVRIDYVYANPALASGLMACDLDASHEAMAASDHLPLVASFKI